MRLGPRTGACRVFSQAWTNPPGRKRTDYSEMPPIRMRDDQYRAVATYVLEEVFAATEEDLPAGAEAATDEVT